MAFTLIEILVVVSIFMILMGLTIASVVRGPKLQRMVAAEQVLADCIRQARHTARTSGQPVVLKLKKDERSIGGLVRQVLWHGVEGPATGTNWPQTEAQDDLGNWNRFDAPGRTGLGLQLPGAYQINGANDDARADFGPDADLAGSKRLWRGITPVSSKQRPGLLMSLAVLPPIAGPGPQIIPLAMVSDAGKGLASYDHAPIGLALVLSTGTSTTGPTASKASLKSVPTWEIVGWFGVGAARTEVSSIENRPAGMTHGDEEQTIVEISGPPLTLIKEYSESGALVGGRWVELTLLVENDRLVLYRDGRRIGEKLGALASDVPAGMAERVYVGVATFQTGIVTFADATGIDDVRVERLGDSLAGTLPSGVTPKVERRIICHPDGRVEVDVNDGSENAAVIELESESGESAELTVSSVGTTTSLTKASP